MLAPVFLPSQAVMPLSLDIRTIHHIAVPTRDTELSAKFYKTVLGLQRMSRPDFNFGGAWLYHAQGQMQLHIIEHESASGERGTIDTLAQHFAMEVDDLDLAEARLKDHGISYKRQINAGGFQQIFFQDPDGNTIEVGVYPSDRAGQDYVAETSSG